MLGDQQIRGALTTAFRFVVSISGMPLAAFTECTLPTVELEVETVKEGGLNTYPHQLPGPHKAAKITLKNGVGVASQVLAMYQTSMNEKFERVPVTVTLYDSLCKPVMILAIQKAYLIRWTGPELRADSNTVAIQTLELACGEITVS